MRAWHDVTLDVAAGEYLVDVALASWPKKIYGARRTVSMAELESTAYRHCVLTSAIAISVIPKGNMGFEVQPFYGLAGIASSSNLVVIGPPAL